MPTMFINGRRKLEAICPNCNCNLANKMGVSESSLVCIPVIGKKICRKNMLYNFRYERYYKQGNEESNGSIKI